MKVAIGNDHHGVELKKVLVSHLEQAGHTVINVGSDTADSVDYPDVAGRVAGKVSVNEADRGILICGSGTGMAIAANKFPGVRAAACYDERTATMSRQHNNTNVICLSADWVGLEDNVRIAAVWMEKEFAGGRHQHRVNKIEQLENSHDSPQCE